MSFVEAMKTQGLTAAAAVRGQRLLKIEQMATPTLLSKTCRICLVRKVMHEPSTWHYRPLIDPTAVIAACDYHTAAAVRGYLG